MTNPLPHPRHLAPWLLISLLLQMACGIVAQYSLWYSLVTTQVIALGVPSLLAYRFLRLSPQQLRWGKPHNTLAWLGIAGIMCGIILFSDVIVHWMQHALGAPQTIAERLPYIFELTSPSGILIRVITLAALPACIEEFLFRGLAQPLCTNYYGTIGGIVLSALLFGMFHHQLWYLPMFFALGCVLGIIKHHYGLRAAIWAHFVNNLGTLIWKSGVLGN